MNDQSSAWQQEVQRSFGRMKNLAALVSKPEGPSVGMTPRAEIYRKHKARLYRYESARKHKTPVLFVPNLGISRPYIFDLLPKRSFIEHMTREGFDFYLLDWGVFGPEDSRLTVEQCIIRILPRMARKVMEAAGTNELSVIGYCMGAPLSASFIATHPDVRVKNFVSMAGPIDFAKAGLFSAWLDQKYFDVDRFVETIGPIPSEMIKAGFKLLKPSMDVSTGLNLWWNLWNDSYVEGFGAMNKWANEYVPFPREFFRQWVKDFYQQNRLIRGELTVGGRLVRLKDIQCPVLVLGALADNIAPPDSVKALLDAVGSTEKEYAEVPGAHISLVAGRAASTHCWPVVSNWLASRS